MGGGTSQDAPAALQALVGRLRRTLGKDAVASDPGGYRLAATRDDVDLYVFEHLVRQGTAALDRGDALAAVRDLGDGLALWRGPALADLPDRSAAARPDALREEATRARIAADLLLGRAADAVPELKELTAAHPYDEPLHALLVRALRDAGRGADALAAYEAVRRALAEGLGTDPGPELRALHGELLTSTAPASTTPPAPGRAERDGNLRPRLTSFVGREPEIAAIRSDVHRARLVTLTGPGGSGKTRLAEEAAASLPQAWLVELARLDRPEAVPGAVVSALGLRETALRTSELVTTQDDPVALLVEHCAARARLLILDNCEHVIGAVADLAETLLTRCPRLTILATSREPLGVPGESVRPVEPPRPRPGPPPLRGARRRRPPGRADRAPGHGRRRGDLPPPRRPAARHRTGRRPAPVAHPAPDRRPPRRPLPPPHLREPHGPAPPADPAGRRRLVLGPARRTGAHRPARAVRVRFTAGTSRRPRPSAPAPRPISWAPSSTSP